MKRLKISENQTELYRILSEVAEDLKRGLVGAIPTETYYALACNPFSPRSVERLISLKERQEGQPILLLLGRLDDLTLVVDNLPFLGKRLIKLFWPGPLTIVFTARKNLPPQLTGGTNTIGVRLSGCELTRKIAQAFGGPITGTSANLSGEPPLNDPEEIVRKLPYLDFIVDAGKTPGQGPSTVVSVVNNQLSLIREGIIPFSEILKKLELEA